jgi:antitoxin MazE
MSSQKLVKWGNSLAVRLPSAFAKSARLSEGTMVNLSVNNGRIVVKPVTEADVSLSSLVRRISSKNLHREADTGPAKGKETW